MAVWYVPLIWLALIVAYLVKGLFLQGTLFVASSALFIAALYYLAVSLNMRFGLYEPPAITVQKSGVYAPKTGLLGKLGFSSAEAALIRKDLRAFTRRRELLSIYILPIIIIIIALFDSLGVTSGRASTQAANPLFFGLIFLLPASAMAMLLGEILIGEEGQAVWRIYASPISAKNLVKSKYFFTVLFSIIILIVSAAIGIVFYHPSLRKTIAAIVEAFFIVLPVASVSLQVGFKGADFSQTRRARMVRQEWSLLGFIVCAIAGAAVLAPVLVLYGLSLLAGASISSLNLAIGVVVSAVISIAVSAVFYRINIDSAQELLRKAEL
jgi:NADH:ubiquinone oxidoreductase subunit K